MLACHQALLTAISSGRICASCSAINARARSPAAPDGGSAAEAIRVCNAKAANTENANKATEEDIPNSCSGTNCIVELKPGGNKTLKRLPLNLAVAFFPRK